MALVEKALKPDAAWETLKLIPLLVLAHDDFDSYIQVLPS